MLYVHSLMGDARPGEVDPDRGRPRASPRSTRGSRRDAARYHGPYRVDVALPAAIGAGKTATATIRVLSAAGVPLPNLDLSLSATGASAVPSTVRTNAARRRHRAGHGHGRGRRAPDGHDRASPIDAPPDLPAVEAAGGAKRPAARGRCVAARLEHGHVRRPEGPGLDEHERDPGRGRLRRPQHRQGDDRRAPCRATGRTSPSGCTGRSVRWRRSTVRRSRSSSGTFQANGPGSYTTAAATLTQPGYYQYQEIAPSDANHIGFTTPCNAPTERVRVQAQPTVHTVVSAKSVAANGSVSDTVTVTGLWGEQVTVQAALYGPFPARNAIACSGTPVWTGAIQVTADGTYQTEPHALATPGYYTYYETIAAGEFVRAVKTPCADVAETTIVPGQPAVKTQISAQQTKPGGTITDKVVVTGIGKLALPVQVALYGPFPTRGAIACSGSPYWHGSFVARGDGTYTTAAVRIEKAGYYTYRETIAASEASPPTATTCAETAETTFSHAQPAVTTITSNEVVRPGAAIFDRVLVRGLGKTAARIRVELFGPFATPSGDRVHHAPPRLDRGHCPGRRRGENAAVPPGEDGVLHLPRAAGRIAARLRVHDSVRGRRRDVARRGRRSSPVAATSPATCASAPARARPRACGSRPWGSTRRCRLSGSTSRTARSRFRRRSTTPAGGRTAPRRARGRGRSSSPATSTARPGAPARSSVSRRQRPEHGSRSPRRQGAPSPTASSPSATTSSVTYRRTSTR